MNSLENICNSLNEFPDSTSLYCDPVRIINKEEVPLTSESNSSAGEEPKIGFPNNSPITNEALDCSMDEALNTSMISNHCQELDQDPELGIPSLGNNQNIMSNKTLQQRLLGLVTPATGLFGFRSSTKASNITPISADKASLDLRETPMIHDQPTQEINFEAYDTNLDIPYDSSDYNKNDACAGSGLYENNHSNTLYNEPIICNPENIKCECKDSLLLSKAFNKLLSGQRLKSFICPRSKIDHNDCIHVLTKHIGSFKGLISMVRTLKNEVDDELYRELLPYFQYFNPKDIRSMIKIYEEITEGYGEDVTVYQIITDLLESTFPNRTSSELLTLSLCLFPAFTYKESGWLYQQLVKMRGEPVLLSTSTLARCLLYLFKIGKLIDMPQVMKRIGKTETHPVLDLPSDQCTLYSPSWSGDVDLETCYKITALIGINGYEKVYERLDGRVDTTEYIDITYGSALSVTNLLQDARGPSDLITGNRQRDACTSCSSPMGSFCTCIHCGHVRLVSHDGSNKPACTAHANILTKEQVRNLGASFLPDDLIGPILIANNINTVNQIKAVESAISDYTHAGLLSNFRLLDDSLKASKDMQMGLESLHSTFQSSLSQMANHMNTERSCIEASTKTTQEMTIAVNNNTQAVNSIRPLSVTNNTTIIKEIIEFLTYDLREPDVMITDEVIKAVVSRDERILIPLGLYHEDLDEE